MKIKLAIILILIVLGAKNIISQEFGKFNVNDTIQLKENTTESINNVIVGQNQTTYSTLWGWMGSGEMGNGSFFPRMDPIQISAENWISIAASESFSIGIKSDSTLWAWGLNNYGQFCNGNSGDTSLIPKQIGQDKNWKYVTVGRNFSFAIKNDGTLWAWGNNYWGSLGDSTTINRFKPVQIGKNVMEKVKLVSSIEMQTLAITEDGSLWSWGTNINGSLGDGTNSDHYYPVKIENTGEWMTVSNGGICSFAIKTNGTLWGWGNNKSGLLGDGPKIIQYKPIQIGKDSNWTAISSTGSSTIALKGDGTLWGWGGNSNGKLGDTTIKKIYTPTQIGKDNDWQLINHHIDDRDEAVKKDGTLWYWGSLKWLRCPQKPEMMLKPTKVDNIGNVTQLSTNAYFYHSFFIRNYIAIPAQIETLPITNITSISAECGGNITSPGSEIIYQRGVCYGFKSNPTIEYDLTEDGTDLGEFQSSMKNLLPFKKYFVRAYVRTAAGDFYGELERFSTKLATPILIFPQNKQIHVPLEISFLWKKDLNALKYRFQLSKFADFSSLVCDKEVVDTVLTYNDLKLYSEYFWRVQTINGEYLSDWSEARSFNTIIFSQHKLLTPMDNAINIPIDYQLKWIRNAKSSGYIFQLSNSGNFSNSIIDTMLNDSLLKCYKLDYLKSFFWHVRCFIGSDSSGWSPVWKFTTLMDLVNLISPVDLSANLELNQNFNWEKGIYEKNYRLQVAKDNDFNNIVFDTLHIQKNDAEIKNLKNYTKYFWRVRNESGDTLGYWSEIWQFRTRMTDVILIYPENEKTGLDQKIKFTWSSVFGAEYYQLQISKNEQFTDIVYSEDSIQATEHNVPDFEPNKLYYWRVRPWNKESIGALLWSEVWTFRTGETSVKDESEFIKIIPNPAGDFITVTLERWSPSSRWTPSSTDVIQIYNTLGEKVMTMEQTPSSVQRINISDLPKGIYFVKVGGETAKFVKM